MRRYVIAALVALAGCSNQEAGQSTYLDAPFEPTAQQRAIVPTDQAEADRILAAQLTQQDERRRFAVDVGPEPDTIFVGGAGLAVEPPLAATGNDDTLVASLEAAIESAGEPGGEPVLSAADLIEQPAAPIQPVTLREGMVETAQAPQAQDGQTSGITDNSFSTVTQRETIESDAERLAALSQETVLLEAEPLPSATTSANLAAFARATQHRIGQRVYPRGRSSRNSSKAARTCRSYGNPDEAQRAFLAAGGPDRDALNLDPDGDGFVCGWSPLPYRSLTVSTQ